MVGSCAFPTWSSFTIAKSLPHILQHLLGADFVFRCLVCGLSCFVLASGKEKTFRDLDLEALGHLR